MKEVAAAKMGTALKQFRVDYVVFYRDYMACQGRYNESVIFHAKDEGDADEQFTEYTHRALRERARDRLQIGSQIVRICISRMTLLPSAVAQENVCEDEEDAMDVDDTADMDDAVTKVRDNIRAGLSLQGR